MRALCNVIVNNIPKECKKRYIVARYYSLDDGLWFHSAWDDETKARRVASEVEGVVCILPEPYKAENKTEQGLSYADQDTLMSAT